MAAITAPGFAHREPATIEAGDKIVRDPVLERRLTLGDMLDPATFAELVKSFAELYKLGVKVFDEKGNRLADMKSGNGDFCGYLFSFADGRSRCTATVARVSV